MRRKDLRICRIATFPRKGAEGIGRASYELTKRLGYKTLYIARQMDSSPIEHDPNIILKEIKIKDEILPPIKADRKSECTKLIKKIFSYWIFCLKGLPAILEFRPHIVHIHSILPIAGALLAKVLLRCKIMVSFHGTDIFRMRKYRFISPVVRRFDHIFYVSRAMEPIIKMLAPPDKCTYTPNGVDCQFFSPVQRQRENVILSVGVLKWQKGMDILIRAFKRFLRDHPDYMLDIVGEGPCEDELKKLVHDLEMEERVLWSGTLSQVELVNKYRQAMSFVLSSLSEGFPKVLVEAMACGCPVICTDTGSCAEIVDGCGIVVKKGSVNELANAMGRVADDTVLRTAIWNKARKRAEKYSWDVATSAVDEVVKKLFCIVDVERSGKEREARGKREKEEAVIGSNCHIENC